MNDAEKPAKDPISLVSETIWGPVVEFVFFHYALMPVGYSNYLQNIRWYNWEVNDAEKPAKDPISQVSETIW